MDVEKPKIIFFGTSEFAVKILEAINAAEYVPIAIITAPDKPKGRKMILTPPPVKTWGEKNNIKIFQPETLENFKIDGDLFVVASYGKILPKELLEIPKFGVLNVHPSLLPEFRGPSPIQSAILDGKEKTGVTIILLDEKMDEGPILASRELECSISNIKYSVLENKLAELGGKLLVETIPKWINGEIKPTPQNQNETTYCRIITKKDGEINWNEPAETIEKKIRAFTPWPGAYTFANNKRVIITEAEITKNLSAKLGASALVIRRVKPEGKKEMPYEEYLKGNSPII